MKAEKPGELNRLTSLGGTTRLYLITGPDESTCTAIGDHLLLLAGKDAERIDLSNEDLKRDPARLATEAASLSLFAGEQVIRLSILGSGDDSVEAVAALLDADAAPNVVVAMAPAMTKKAKLMKLAEDSPLVRCAICYQPDTRELIAIAVAAARDEGLQLASREAAMLVDLVSGDQKLLVREIEKLALYRDAAPDRQRQVAAEDIIALGAGIDEEDIGACINIAMTGKVVELPAMLATAEAVGVADIRMLRALAVRVQLLVRLRAEVDGGQHPRTLVDDRRYGIFWKEKDAVTAQLRLWDSIRLARLMTLLLGCERALKASGTAGSVLMRRLLVDIARQAARAR
ncbi:MAG: DNA polymerase III subunit delta [Sphingopyxis sp.]|nr:DNA polymerase III subunit delta [Sphingopyxis sp.]